MKTLKSTSALVACLIALCGTSFVNAAGIAVVMSVEADPVSVDMRDVRDIFLGKSSRLPNGKLVFALDQKPSEARDVFLDKLVEKSAPQLKSYWTQLVFTGRGNPPRQVSSDIEVKEFVSANPSMIGYIDLDSVDDTVQVLIQIE